MNGLIGVDSKLGQGSIFYFSLPQKDLTVTDTQPVMNVN